MRHSFKRSSEPISPLKLSAIRSVRVFWSAWYSPPNPSSLERKTEQTQWPTCTSKDENGIFSFFLCYSFISLPSLLHSVLPFGVISANTNHMRCSLSTHWMVILPLILLIRTSSTQKQKEISVCCHTAKILPHQAINGGLSAAKFDVAKTQVAQKVFELMKQMNMLKTWEHARVIT